MDKRPNSSTNINTFFRLAKTRGRVETGEIGKFVLLIGVVFILISIYWSVTSFKNLQKPMEEILSSDEDFKGMQVEVKYAKFLRKDVILFDLKKVSMKTQLMAPFKLLLNYLIRLEDGGKPYKRMEIQYKGKTRFAINRETVSALVARTYAEKPADIALDFPGLVETPGGKKPYVQPYGDEQYVAQKKYHNFEQLMDTWFLNDMRKPGTAGEKPEKKEADSGKKKPSKTSETPGEIPEIPNVIDDELTDSPDKPYEIPQEKPVEKSPVKEPAPEKPAASPTDEIPPIEPEEI